MDGEVIRKNSRFISKLIFTLKDNNGHGNNLSCDPAIHTNFDDCNGADDRAQQPNALITKASKESPLPSLSFNTAMKAS